MRTRIDINELAATPTSHGVGKKKVILTGNDSKADLTQVAFGELNPGEIVDEHVHQDMEEYYFFTEGEGKYIIDGVEHLVTKDIFIFVKAKQSHRLVNSRSSVLKFFYWGSTIKS